MGFNFFRIDFQLNFLGQIKGHRKLLKSKPLIIISGKKKWYLLTKWFLVRCQTTDMNYFWVLQSEYKIFYLHWQRDKRNLIKVMGCKTQGFRWFPRLCPQNSCPLSIPPGGNITDRFTHNESVRNIHLLPRLYYFARCRDKFRDIFSLLILYCFTATQLQYFAWTISRLWFVIED